MKGQRIGYVRVSTFDQNVDRQLDGQSLDRIFTDKASGKDINRPDFGDPVEIRSGEEPVFWACGVTPQAVALNSKPSLMITHAPGHMFITDQRDADYAVL